MSRSRKHTPIFGHGGESEKKDKKILHSIMRTRVRTQLAKDPEDYLDPLPEECHSVWSMSKDGKSYWTKKSRFPENQEWLDALYKKMMRK